MRSFGELLLPVILVVVTCGKFNPAYADYACTQSLIDGRGKLVEIYAPTKDFFTEDCNKIAQILPVYDEAQRVLQGLRACDANDAKSLANDIKSNSSDKAHLLKRQAQFCGNGVRRAQNDGRPAPGGCGQFPSFCLRSIPTQTPFVCSGGSIWRNSVSLAKLKGCPSTATLSYVDPGTGRSGTFEVFTTSDWVQTCGGPLTNPILTTSAQCATR